MTKTPESTGANPDHPPKALIVAVRRILRPLVRGFIRFGLTYALLSDILKRTYVDIAWEEFRLDADKRTSDSRVSLLTRVHRKDIRNFRLNPAPPSLDLADHSVSAQIVARWLADKKYLAKDNSPKPLPRSGKDGFDQLATSISKDMHPRAILDELVRTGTAIEGEGDQIYLNVSAFVPQEDFNNLAWYYGLNLHDHIAASTHNIAGNKPAFLDRSVHYSGLRQQSVAELEKMSRDLGMETLLVLNAKASELESRDNGSADANQRMTFGIYFFGDKDE
jgi:hypothetical protein